VQAADGTLVAQQDNPPVRGTQPTTEWKTGVLVEDPYEIRLPSDAAVGDYVLSTGMYDTATMERLPAHGAGRERLPEDRVVLGRVRVEPVVPWWRWALTFVWLMLASAGGVWTWLRRQG
jgi:hypothetical protein